MNAVKKCFHGDSGEAESDLLLSVFYMITRCEHNQFSPLENYDNDFRRHRAAFRHIEEGWNHRPVSFTHSSLSSKVVKRPKWTSHVSSANPDFPLSVQNRRVPNLKTKRVGLINNHQASVTSSFPSSASRLLSGLQLNKMDVEEILMLFLPTMLQRDERLLLPPAAKCV